MVLYVALGPPGGASLKQIVTGFELSEGALANRLKHADTEDGASPARIASRPRSQGRCGIDKAYGMNRLVEITGISVDGWPDTANHISALLPQFARA